ncbi:PREDICTED: uncharacterized protein LOC103922920 isoform X9 [Pygoscelis adeliae]|uniref:uncharacterized protein LOC103922920 isoform X9 n=1 Tax=Pygoscelis adeliae TaxID=9238 RepID=UPI0004F4E976|nr:PREDICTED: uncharacterized protein LOC103922920 isoform X9 [Pygoscelis adeliae]
MMESGKRNADLEEWDAKIRKLTEEFEESDTELEECDTENEIGELTAEIDNLTAELEERDRKITKLAAEIHSLRCLVSLIFVRNLLGGLF